MPIALDSRTYGAQSVVPANSDALSMNLQTQVAFANLP